MHSNTHMTDVSSLLRLVNTSGGVFLGYPTTEYGDPPQPTARWCSLGGIVADDFLTIVRKETYSLPAPNNNKTARVALRVQRDTRDFINTFHMARTDNAALTTADLVNMGGVVADWWLNSYRTAVPSVVVGIDIVATKQDPSDPLQSTTFIAAPGNHPGTILPGDVTAAVSWRTGLAGRKMRGRFYDFGMSQGDNNSNDSMTGGYIAQLTSVGQYLLNHLATAGLKLIVFHRSDNTYTDIIAVIVDQLIDSMRRRLAGRGI